MDDNKQKRETENIVELDTEETGFLMKPANIEIGSGYTLFVKYDEKENPIIDVKTYGQVDLAKLSKEIEKAFPNAKIRQLDQNHSQPIIVAKKRRKPHNKKKRK